MPCNQWREEWVARLYDEVSPEERQTIDRHLSRCASCRETMRELEQSRGMLAASNEPVPDAPRVVVIRPRRGWGNAWAFAGGLAAATLVFFIGALLRSPTLDGLEERLARIEAAPGVVSAQYDDTQLLTRAQFEEEMQRVSQRHRRQRAEDLDYLIRWLSASEQRTGTFMDRTQEALTYLALRGDPHVRER